MTNDWARTALDKGDKGAARRLLKNFAARFTDIDERFSDDEDGASLAAQSLFMDKDPVGINLVVSIIVAIFTLRDEFMAWAPGAWAPGQRRPGLTEKEYARIDLGGFAASVSDVSTAMSVVDKARAVETGSIDYLCSLVDAVSVLREEFVAWDEFGNHCTAILVQ